ncbi:origin recognition complex subunit 4 [Kappamyces sp. JEL0680]|nr:origin recognition complex subunit 4 [Kappamyces sp. JEL0680]
MVETKRFKPKSILQDRLYSLPLQRFDSQLKDLAAILKDTLQTGKGSSVLLQGPSGCGKSRVLETVLEDLRKEESQQFYTIYLDGIVHTDDKMALMSIIRQLNHESRQLDPGAEDDLKLTNLSFSDRLLFVLNTLKTGGSNSTPVVFVLDEMHLFAEHINQILLYNLFDIAQSQQTPICVNCISLLEKRVKSRFSHRFIDFFALASKEDFTAVARCALTLTADDPVSAAVRADFNDHVDAFFKDAFVRGAIQDLFDLSNHSHVIQALDQQHPYVNPKVFSDYTNALHQDQRSITVQELSLLEVCMLTSIKKYIQRTRDLKTPQPNFNFELIMEEYMKLVTHVSRFGQGVGRLHFKKPVAFKAFEQLSYIGLIKFEGGAAANAPKEYRMTKCLLTVEQISDALKSMVEDLPRALAKWYGPARLMP